MASLKMLFLGVHTSNSLVRTLFLPACYIVLSSPFILAVGWYFGFGQNLQQYIPEDFSWFDIVPQLALSAVFLLLPTRLWSASSKTVKSKDGRTRRIQSSPYWIPGLRHLSSIMFSGEAWLRSVRESSIQNIIAYNAAASKHYVLLSTSMLEQLSKHAESLEEAKGTRWGVLRNAFRMPKRAQSQYFELEPAVNEIIESEMVQDKQRQTLISTSLKSLTESLPDFTTFNSSIVDQMQWERVANVELMDGTSETECDLFALVNEFCCNAIMPSIMGTQFTESYQLLATDLATLNSKFWALSLGLPRLSPVQGLPGASLAQKRLSQNLMKLFDDLTDPPVRRVPDDDESISGEEETDADIVTPVMKLNELFMKEDLHLDVRAAIALQFVNDIVVEVVPLTFWTLVHIYSEPESSSGVKSTLESIRHETRSWAQAFQPPSIHPSFPAPPEIRFPVANMTTALANSPHLTSCINESRRLYACSMSTYKMTKPIILEDGDNARPGEQEQWELEVGSYIDVGVSSSLINSSESNYTSPATFQPDRFLHYTPPSPNLPSHSPQAYKTSLVSAMLAGVLQLWEIAPAPKRSFLDQLQEASSEAAIGSAPQTREQKEAASQAKKEQEIKDKKIGKWVFPKAVDGATVKVPRTDIRVRIRRREGLPASKIVGRIG